VVQARIATYPEGALQFSLMAIHDDTLPALQAELAAREAAGDIAATHELLSRIAQETEKRSTWAFENSLRRHNHVGLVYGLALALAKAGRLSDVTAKAKTKMAERIERQRKAGKAMDVEDD